ncbi:hypothetical protein P3X46_027707 [Hevea brasiliensis]|uniref:ATP-dependent (S)-NAD(P)H-hydrate dehydratase n=1 Tax=Hevea brasiliensis TaxID=3981 RepID=A0ABQ9L2D6_HEVBR|nr:hypothetical protein P3X46_027707 [Hevea brasiliensis]
MNHLNTLSSARYCALASPTVLRRQHILIRSLGGGGHHKDCTKNRMQETKPLEADAENILRGAVLSHVFCTKDAAPVIKSYSPQLIVHPISEESCSIGGKNISRKVVAEVDKWMERFDCKFSEGQTGDREGVSLNGDCVSEIMKQARQSNVPIIVDGDGLFLVTNSIDLVSGYPLAVLTPNVNEYKRLVHKVLNCEVHDQDADGQLLYLSKRIGGVTILRKGKSDLISDGEIVQSVTIDGSPRHCGGRGDILSGRPTNPTVLECIAGSALLRRAASLAFENRKRSTLTSDIIECLGRSLEDIFPA